MSKGIILLLMCFPITSFVVLAEPLEVVTEDMYPYSYMDKGEVTGSATQMVIKIIENAGLEYTLNLYPWSRSYGLALHRKNVLIFTISRTPHREKLFKWVRPLSGKEDIYVVALYKLKDNTSVNPTSLAQTKNFSVVAYRNSVTHQWLDNHGFKKVHVVNERENILPMLIHGRVDMLAMDTRVIGDELRLHSYDMDLLTQLHVLFHAPSYMALSLSTSDEVLMKLQASYDDLLKRNALQLF